MGARHLKLLATALAVIWPVLVSAAPYWITVCLDYGCDYTGSAEINVAEWREVGTVFADVTSAETERMAVSQAIGTLERIVGSKVGTAQDAPGNAAPDTKIIGQLDCIAESTNTEKYLQLLAADDHLLYHRVVGREVRRRWLFATHWTAVIEEIATGEKFAIDSWHGANGEPALVQPLAMWHRAETAEHASR